MLSEADLVVFTDVDAVLSAPGHHSGPAADALLDATAKGVPLVFCSTRTRAEIEAVQRDMGLVHPFICENGAAVFVPAGYFGSTLPNARAVDGYDVVEFGPPYAEVVASLGRHAAALGIEIVGFNDLTTAEIADECGLSPDAAERARRREYGEPFRFVRPGARNRRALGRALRADGLGVTSGGWLDLAGPLVDESAGITLLRGLFAAARGPVLTVGFGDPLMDVALLRHVDVPLTIPLPVVPRAARLLAKTCRCATPTEHRFRRRAYRHLDLWSREPSARM